MKFNKTEESALEVLDRSLREVYPDKVIAYDPIWQEPLKEVMVATENLSGHSGREISEKILELFWLSVTVINECACVSRRRDSLQPIFS